MKVSNGGSAYPFAFGLDKALRYAGRLVGSISHSPIRSEAAYYLRSHAVSPIQPEFAAAIYLPTWVIDAEVKADFWPKPDNETPARKVGFARNLVCVNHSGGIDCSAK